MFHSMTPSDSDIHFSTSNPNKFEIFSLWLVANTVRPQLWCFHIVEFLHDCLWTNISPIQLESNAICLHSLCHHNSLQKNAKNTDPRRKFPARIPIASITTLTSMYTHFARNWHLISPKISFFSFLFVSFLFSLFSLKRIFHWKEMERKYPIYCFHYTKRNCLNILWWKSLYSCMIDSVHDSAMWITLCDMLTWVNFDTHAHT